jgi:hypothetical protein
MKPMGAEKVRKLISLTLGGPLLGIDEYVDLMAMKNEIEVVAPWLQRRGMAIAIVTVLLGKVQVEQQLYSLVDGTNSWPKVALAVRSHMASDNLM